MSISSQPARPYEGIAAQLLDRNRCPACLSWATFAYGGGEFMGCNHCRTISAVDRRTTAKYDHIYVASRYDRYKTTRPMSVLRLHVLHTVLQLNESLEKGYIAVQKGPLLDVGYGNGDFIRVARSEGWEPYGNDVNPAEYEGVERVDLPPVARDNRRYRAITFFDALEHFEDLSIARWCSHYTDWLLLSFPAVPDNFPFDKNWKHYRPGEHHLHFQPESLEKIFSHNGRVAEIVYKGSPEDNIRPPARGSARNIWTVALRCRDATG